MNVEINRLKWRSKRSMLEVDLYLDRFIQNEGLEKLNTDELKAYGEMLESKDPDLLLLLQGVKRATNNSWQIVINKICTK